MTQYFQVNRSAAELVWSNKGGAKRDRVDGESGSVKEVFIFKSRLSQSYVDNGTNYIPWFDLIKIECNTFFN